MMRKSRAWFPTSGDKTYLDVTQPWLADCRASTVADAFLNMYVFEAACTIQVRAQAGGGELIQIPSAIINGAQQQAKAVTKSLGGMLAWPGLLRRLERKDASYRT